MADEEILDKFRKTFLAMKDELVEKGWTLEGEGRGARFRSPYISTLEAMDGHFRDFQGMVVRRLQEDQFNPEVVSVYCEVIEDLRKHEMRHAASDVHFPKRGGSFGVDSHGATATYYPATGRISITERAINAMGPGIREMTPDDWVIVIVALMRIEQRPRLKAKYDMNGMFIEASRRVREARKRTGLDF